MNEHQAEEFHRRCIALDHAVRTHEHLVDEKLIVKAAQEYLSFLKGEEVGQVHGPSTQPPISNAFVAPGCEQFPEEVQHHSV